RLLLIGGAALAAVVAVVLIVVFATQGGGRKPAAKPSASSAATAAPAGAGAQNADKLDSFLLSAAEIGTIMGDPGMAVAGKTDELRPSPGTLSAPECFGAYEPLLRESYEGADGFVAARGQAIQTPGEDPAHRTYEAVVAFGSAEKAHAFVQASADKWRPCADRAVTLSAPECFGAYEPLLRESYEGADGFVAARGQAIQTPGEDPAHRTYEAVVAFGSAEKAHAFVQASADKWRPCADRAVTLTTQKRTFEWTFGRLEGEPRNRIWMEKVETGGAGRTCHRLLSAQTDVVVDVLACAAAGTESPAGKVADQIAAKIEH
ncbi:sensor domain-containing protein, partial [Mycobacterium kiyosense]|uniref:sensor domain-containing protein n=1 Tax=Mycobacterium kiyosense TaxID=2871094 RepID=UPI0022313C23